MILAQQLQCIHRNAPALALADVGDRDGVGATDVAVETADVALAGHDLRALLALRELSRSCVGLIRQNYAMSIAVNATGLLVSAAGTLSPVLAAILHNASSVAVVAGKLRRLRLIEEDGQGCWPQPRWMKLRRLCWSAVRLVHRRWTGTICVDGPSNYSARGSYPSDRRWRPGLAPRGPIKIGEMSVGRRPHAHSHAPDPKCATDQPSSRASPLDN